MAVFNLGLLASVFGGYCSSLCLFSALPPCCGTVSFHMIQAKCALLHCAYAGLMEDRSDSSTLFDGLTAHLQRGWIVGTKLLYGRLRYSKVGR